MKKNNYKILIFPIIFCFFLSFSFYNTKAQNWDPANLTAPDGNTVKPINIGNVPSLQTKAGRLKINQSLDVLNNFNTGNHTLSVLYVSPSVKKVGVGIDSGTIIRDNMMRVEGISYFEGGLVLPNFSSAPPDLLDGRIWLQN
jgi:hypothetical protein